MDQETALLPHRFEIEAAIARSEADIEAGRVTDSDDSWNEVLATVEGK